MQRLLVQVQGKKLKKRYTASNGLGYGRYALTVEVQGPAVEALGLPDGVVGRRASITRDFLLPWVVKRGDLLVLDPAESARFLRPRGRETARRAALPVSGADIVALDVDGDGFAEDVFRNVFATAAVQPHRGARVASLVGADGGDRFARPLDHIMAGKYVLLGGAEETIVEGGAPDEIWKSRFDRVAGGSDGAPEIRYTRALKSPEGLSVEKTVRVGPTLPGVATTFTARYAGRAAGGENETSRPGGKDTSQVTLAVRISTPVLGDVGARNVFSIPGGRSVRTVRYHRPGGGRRWRWRDWRDEHFGIAGGYVVSRHEESGNVLVVLFHPRRVGHVTVRSDFTGPEIAINHRTATIARGRRRTWGAAYLVGDSVAVGPSSFLLVSRGAEGQRGVPVAFTVRTAGRPERVSAVVEAGAGSRRIRLSRLDVPEVGTIFTRTAFFDADALPRAVSTTVGGSVLSIRMEA
jgi:hypothetical protein